MKTVITKVAKELKNIKSIPPTYSGAYSSPYKVS